MNAEYFRDVSKDEKSAQVRLAKDLEALLMQKSANIIASGLFHSVQSFLREQKGYGRLRVIFDRTECKPLQELLEYFHEHHMRLLETSDITVVVNSRQSPDRPVSFSIPWSSLRLRMHEARGADMDDSKNEHDREAAVAAARL